MPRDKSRDLEHLIVLRQVLQGCSPIDLQYSVFSDRTSVDDFLRLCGFDTDNSLDVARLGQLHREAVLYLNEVHHFVVPDEIVQARKVHELFLRAADKDDPLQRFACSTLKVMHILHHLRARQLLYNTAVSEAELFNRLNTKVLHVLDRMRCDGIGLREFAAGQKRHASLVTKLLCKRNVQIADVFDRLRFRIVTESRKDLLNALMYLLKHLVPFNYCVPEQSRHGIITFADIAEYFATDIETIERYWGGGSQSASSAEPMNEFSGQSYQCVNFIAGIPLRIDDLTQVDLPAIGFVQCEIQLVDVETDIFNNRGENDHSLYKERQNSFARQRLEKTPESLS